MTFKKIFSIVALPVLAMAAAQDASAYSPPAGLGGSPTGVPAAGFPDFYNFSDLTFSKVSSGYKLTATRSSSSNLTFNTSPTKAWDVDKVGGGTSTVGSFDFSASFDKFLNFTGGSVSIQGKIPNYNGPGATTFGGVNVKTGGNLYKANLVNMGVDLSPAGLGFTTNASNDTGWATQFMTSNESVWFYLGNIWQQCLDATLNPTNARSSSWSIRINGVNTVTTVPVPAAVWLFGSALAGMLRFGRRKAAA